MLLRRVLLTGMLAFFLIGLMLPSSILTLSPIPKAQAASHPIRLAGAFYTGWNGSNPGPTITVTKGDTVSLTLVSGDSAPHTFIIDVDKDGVIASPNCLLDKCSPQFTNTVNYQFTVDFGPGTYTYYCSIHLTSMIGTFIVPGPDYGASSNPSSLTIPQGASANSSVSITSLNNFAGSVTLTSSPSSPPGLLTSSFSVNPVIVPPSGTAKSNFTISVPTGTSPASYSITVTAKNSTTFSHSTTVSVTVVIPDFKITLSSPSLAIPPGSSGSVMVTLTSLSGFSGTVSLTTTLSSPGPQLTFSPTSVVLSSSGSTSSTLSVSAASSGAYSTPVPQGNYNVNVTGTSGSLVHSATLALTVGSSSGAGALPTSAIIGVGIASAIAVVAAIIYFLRRRPKTKR